MVGIIYVYVDTVFGFLWVLFIYCLEGFLSTIVWVSYMHVFSIFVFAPVQRN